MFGRIGLSYLLLCDNATQPLAYTGKVGMVATLHVYTYLPRYVRTSCAIRKTNVVIFQEIQAPIV